MNTDKKQAPKKVKPATSGRQPLYGPNEKTRRIMISIPASKEKEVRVKIDDVLKPYENKFITIKK